MYLFIYVFINFFTQYNWLFKTFSLPPPPPPQSPSISPSFWARSMLPTPLAAPSNIQACSERADLDLGSYISSEYVWIFPGLDTSGFRACAHCIGSISAGARTGGCFFAICPPPQPPCKVLTPLAAQIGICPYGRPPRLPPPPAERPNKN